MVESKHSSSHYIFLFIDIEIYLYYDNKRFEYNQLIDTPLNNNSIFCVKNIGFICIIIHFKINLRFPFFFDKTVFTLTIYCLKYYIRHDRY